MTSGFFLAVELIDKAKPMFGPQDSLPRDLLALFGSIIFVGGVIAIWAIYFRKGKKSGSSHRHHSRKTLVVPNKSHRHRKHRREHRPRNPTLAESGGLPPPRADDSPNYTG